MLVKILSPETPQAQGVKLTHTHAISKIKIPGFAKLFPVKIAVG